jgi:hypothetical protein
MQNVDHPGRGSVDWIRRMIVAFAALSVVSGILYGDTGSSKAALATGARVRPLHRVGLHAPPTASRNHRRQRM